VASRRKFAKYAYNKAATGEGQRPTIRDNPSGQALIDNFVSTIDLGPTPNLPVIKSPWQSVPAMATPSFATAGKPCDHTRAGPTRFCFEIIRP